MVSEIQILSTKYADSNNSKIKHKIPFNLPLIRFKPKSKMKKKSLCRDICLLHIDFLRD